MLRALLYFHSRVGVRVALRASPPLFCGIVALIVFQDSPSGELAIIARLAYSSPSPFGIVFSIAAMALVLPAWGRQRLSQGMKGWIRHLPLSAAMHRAGLLLALMTVQLPLAVMLVLLALIAARMGLSIGWPSLRW